jgi:flagellar biosynthesis protein FliR
VSSNQFAPLLESALLPLQNLDKGWAFLLLTVRFTCLFSFLPGIGGGVGGLRLRTPCILLISFVVLPTVSLPKLPTDFVLAMSALFSEALLGGIIGFLPTLVIAGVHTAGQLSSVTMGLSASQIFDPTMGASTTQLSKIWEDLSVLLFLLIDGHHAFIYGAATYASEPGTFLVGAESIDILISQWKNLFEFAVLVSSPILVCLFLVQFALGVLSKVVSQLNIFSISFPITLGIGLIISILLLPQLLSVSRVFFQKIDSALPALIQLNK